MDDLVAFLKAQLDEDEAAANEVHRPGDCGCIDRDGDFDPDPVWCGCGYPARVLREVAAKRAHLAEYESAVSGCLEWGITSVLESILYSDAAVYSDHPGYRAEWKP